jgi:asparagine synthase (glutamine-hydrolysing)
VRASVGNWLIARAIREKTDCKVVFNGDGSDEVFGSYLYFYRAPSDFAFERETQRLLEEIHMYDVLRSDRCISSNGLEPRTPFLDKQFVAVARSIATEWLRPIKGMKPEKWLLRRAFDDGVTLPHEVLWRRKEAFSDGVSGHERSWFQIIRDYIDTKVTNEEYNKYIETQTDMNMGMGMGDSDSKSHNSPYDKESYYYRTIFDKLYKGCEYTIPYFWRHPFCEEKDPSARLLTCYKAE